MSNSLDEVFRESEKKEFVVKSVMNSLIKWENHFLPEGLMLLPWRIPIYTTLPGSNNISQRWHYDTNTTNDVIFFMLNLSDCEIDDDAGTYFIDAFSSARISLENDYISAPVMHRASNLDPFLDNTKTVNHQPSISGRLVAFQPGRTLHKGSCGKKGRRDNIHISTTVVQKSTSVKGAIGTIPLQGNAWELRDICAMEAGSFAACQTTGAPYYINERP